MRKESFQNKPPSLKFQESPNDPDKEKSKFIQKWIENDFQHGLDADIMKLRMDVNSQQK